VTESARSGTHTAFGDYVRSQRQLAQLSLRQAAALARISNPYLSQIEHGLALPSVTVLRALAEALQVSADTLLLRAAGMHAADGPARTASTEDAIRHDPRLDDGQKRALLAVLTSYVDPAPSPAPRRRPPRNHAPAPARAPARPQKGS
jgi:transcriptional regulator with XRE-family HTH domain